MIRCVTDKNNVLLASESEEESTRALSKDGRLLCPNCLKQVRFNKGPIKGAYFSHLPKSECVVTNYEKETKQHLQGKEILYKWLKSRFKNAKVELEVYIPRTHQIADILVTHNFGAEKGSTWAFEFQHSPLSSKDWTERHNLYREADIHDFWIFNAEIFLLYSNSKDTQIQKARRWRDPVETIFTTTGFCYFLNLDNLEVTIDFSFRYENISVQDRFGRRYPPKEYKFHSPLAHSCNLNDINFLYNKEFNYGAMSYEEINTVTQNKFDIRIRQFEEKKQQKWDNELQAKERAKQDFYESKYGGEFSGYMHSFMKVNKEDIKYDIYELSEEDFFDKYEKYVVQLQNIAEEISDMEEKNTTNSNIILKMYNKEEISKLIFLAKQDTVEKYYLHKYSKQIEIINYVLTEYASFLEEITSSNTKIISDLLTDIDIRINPYKSNPTKFDYAFEYHKCKTIEEVDNLIMKIKKGLNKPKPYIDISKL